MRGKRIYEETLLAVFCHSGIVSTIPVDRNCLANVGRYLPTKPSNNGEKENIGKKVMESSRRPTAPRKISSNSRNPADSHHDAKANSSNGWGNDFKPESPPPLPIINLSESCFPSSTKRDLDRNCEDGTFNLKINKGTLKTGLHAELDMSERNLQRLKNSKNDSVNASTSTLFHDPQRDITILLTTPEDDIPALNFSELSSPRSRSSSVASLPAIPLHKGHLNTSLLMPPNDSQRDQRGQQQVEEIKEVRKWLISFINAKGDTFPRKVRQKMMDEYRISEWDLAPQVVAKFNAEEPDEGASIDEDNETDQKESLQILSQAFQSQIEEVTPKCVDRTPLPITRNRRNSRPVAQRSKSMLITIPDDEELPPTWLGPLISTTIDSRDSVLADPQYLKKSFSTPDLHISPRPELSTHISAPVLEAESKRRLERTRGRKSGGLRSAFGNLVESIGGGSSGVKALKKSRLGHPISSNG